MSSLTLIGNGDLYHSSIESLYIELALRDTRPPVTTALALTFEPNSFLAFKLWLLVTLFELGVVNRPGFFWSEHFTELKYQNKKYQGTNIFL